jgi:ATP-dependent DNA helicase PIF1
MISDEQRRVLELIGEHKNVFLTGGGGVGKSFIINVLVNAQREQGRVVAVCASTGVAADHIGGVTLHSLLGQGLASEPLDELIQMAHSKRGLRAKWMHIDLLVIDEISMLDPVFFVKVDLVLRALRHCDAPFGGVQLLLAGDFFQLPPVTPRVAVTSTSNTSPSQKRKNGFQSSSSVTNSRASTSGSSLSSAGVVHTFCFETPSWNEAVDAIVELKYSFRQSGDNVLGELLNRARVGECTLEDIELLADRVDAPFTNARFEGIEPTRMHSRRTNVDSINEEKLLGLGDGVHTELYNAQVTYNVLSSKRKIVGDVECESSESSGNQKSKSEKLKELQRVGAVLQQFNNTAAKSELQLRIGAQVMLLCNMDVENGLVNGSRGVVTEFRDLDGIMNPVVRFSKTGTEIVINGYKWEYKIEGAGSVFYTQIPLQLAWAITIHKAQGLSLDCVEMALDNSVFERGQAYVALSRVTSLEGLRLISFKPGVILAHPLVKQFYANINKAENERHALINVDVEVEIK